VSRADYDVWLDRWSALPNTAVTDPGSYPATIAAADLLLTDGLSMLVEFQLFERPLVFVERQDHRPFNEIGELVRRGAHSATCVADARRLAEKLLAAGSDSLQPVQRENVATLFGPPGAADRILGVLRTLIADETARGLFPS
jgi:CDP-glycerol glycerophosphotransferase (TagB/SpsB family)